MLLSIRQRGALYGRKQLKALVIECPRRRVNVSNSYAREYPSRTAGC